MQPLYRFRLNPETGEITKKVIKEYTNFSSIGGTDYYKYRENGTKGAYKYCKTSNIDKCYKDTVYSFSPDDYNAACIFFNCYHEKYSKAYDIAQKYRNIYSMIESSMK